MFQYSVRELRGICHVSTIDCADLVWWCLPVNAGCGWNRVYNLLRGGRHDNHTRSSCSLQHNPGLFWEAAPFVPLLYSCWSGSAHGTVLERREYLQVNGRESKLFLLSCSFFLTLSFGALRSRCLVTASQYFGNDLWRMHHRLWDFSGGSAAFTPQCTWGCLSVGRWCNASFLSAPCGLSSITKRWQKESWFLGFWVLRCWWSWGLLFLPSLVPTNKAVSSLGKLLNRSRSWASRRNKRLPILQFKQRKWGGALSYLQPCLCHCATRTFNLSAWILKFGSKGVID